MGSRSRLQYKVAVHLSILSIYTTQSRNTNSRSVLQGSSTFEHLEHLDYTDREDHHVKADLAYSMVSKSQARLVGGGLLFVLAYGLVPSGWLLWLAALGLSGAVLYANLPSAWILPQEKATETFLAQAKLQEITGGQVLPSSRSLWRENGAVVMAVRRPG